MEDGIVSLATKNNWKRLNVTDIEGRLSKRANKRFSVKNIIPVEYLFNQDNIAVLKQIVLYARESDISINSVIYNLVLNLLRANRLIDIFEGGCVYSENKYLSDILSECAAEVNEFLLNISLPKDEKDFLGIVYQSLLNEGKKNQSGSYYTPDSIVQKITRRLNSNSKFLDPCCGTGSFLLSASDKILNPQNLYGFDIDKIACFIAKINLIVKFKTVVFRPNIFNTDFLASDFDSGDTKFDVIATNPPWGAMTDSKYKDIYPDILSGESFSYFIVQAEKFLSKKGYCAFVLPESILNVAQHKDIRKFILDNFYIEEIQLLGKPFSGVLTGSVLLEMNKSYSVNNITIIENNKEKKLLQKVYLSNENYNFSIMSNFDFEIISKIYSVEYETLEDSLWALGIVTGDNKKHIVSSFQDGTELIYTGKDVSKYFLKPASKYIRYNRKNFQQAASDSLYRSSEKLVYKFISKKLVFAYDNSESLFLNSANILIPNVKTHSAKTALAFLNSEVFQYIYMKKFNELKILKGNLMQLPFPVLSSKIFNELEELVGHYLSNRNILHLNDIDDMIYKIFKITDEEKLYIKNEIL